MQPADILALTAPNSSGVVVPLSTIAVAWENGMEQSQRFNGYPAMELTGALPKAILRVMNVSNALVDDLGGAYSLEWTASRAKKSRAARKP